MKWIGKYRVLGLLGRGGMGRIYKVVRPELGRSMALKLLKPDELQEDLWGEEELRRQFLQEARVMGGLDHEHIASVLDIGEADGRPFMVLEYYCLNLGKLIGESYRVEEPARSLFPGKAIEYAEQTLLGLGRLHYAGILHRDVKPFNLMLSREGRIKLIDFGLSRVRGEMPARPRGAVVGSPFYTAPEQEEDPEKADRRADLFGLGVVLYRLLTGSLPDEDLRAIQSEPFLGREWVDFFRLALSRDPAGRFGNAWQMLEALQRLKERWQEARDRACKLPESAGRSRRSAAPARVRSRPIRTGPVKGVPFPGLTALYQPEVYQANEYRRSGENGLEDRSTGLVWFVKAPPLPLSWEDAGEYAASLARELGGQAGSWRLPTVEELLTLLQPRFRPEDFCLPAVFGGSRPWLWSSDERTCSAAWFVDAGNGSVLWQDKACAFWILPVQTAQESSGTASQ